MANQEEYNYLLNYHAMSDTFDKVDLAQLKKHVAEAAGLTIGLANAATHPGERLHHAGIDDPPGNSSRTVEDFRNVRFVGDWQAWQKRLGSLEHDKYF